MKNAILLCLLLLYSVQQTNAQQGAEVPKLEWGALQKEPFSSAMREIIGADKSGFYSHRYNSKVKPYRFIEHYDHSMVRKHSAGLELMHEGKKLDFEYFIQYHEDLYVISSLNEQKQKTHQVFVQKIDKSSLLPTDKPRVLFTIDYSADKKEKRGRFSYTLSDDHSKILFYYIVPSPKDNPEQTTLLVLDQEFMPIWEKQINTYYKGDDVAAYDWALDNEGHVYMLGRLYLSETTPSTVGQTSRRHLLFRISNHGEIIETYPIALPDHQINKLKLGISPGQKVICAGFYSASGSSTMGGSYFISVDAKTGMIDNTHAQEFDKHFLTEGLKEGKAEKIKAKIDDGANYELSNFNYNAFSFRQDGGVVLLGEYYKEYTLEQKISTGVVSYTTYYDYNNIVVVNLTATGQIDWAHQIAKKQSTEDDNGIYSSYKLSLVEDKLYFLFNDHPDNLNAIPGKVKTMKTSAGKTILVAVVLDKEGTQRRIPLENPIDSKVIFSPWKCFDLAPSHLMIFGQKGKAERFAHVTF